MAKVDRSGILKATLTNSFPPKIKAIVETSKKTLDRKKKTSNFLSMTYSGSWQNSFFCLRHIKIYIETNFNSIQMSHKLGIKNRLAFDMQWEQHLGKYLGGWRIILVSLTTIRDKCIQMYSIVRLSDVGDPGCKRNQEG